MKIVLAAIIVDKGRVLIARRAIGQNLEGKWEFPGGKLEAGETHEECIVREIKEELDIDILTDVFFGESIFESSQGKIRLLAYTARRTGGEIALSVHDRVEWVLPMELGEYDFAPADIPFAIKIINDRH